jgi:hypothetical protein
MRKKIIVCGDSFCSADTNKPNTHFSELLLDNYEIINLARGGVSNTVICLQLQTAVTLDPDLIIFNTTDSNRTEFVYNNRPVNDISLKDIIYPYSSDSSYGSTHVGNVNARYMSDVWPAILTPRPDNPLKYSDSKIQNLKNYFTEIFDEPLKQLIDKWIIGYWKTQLEKEQIPTVEISSRDVGKELYQYCVDNPAKVMQAVYHTDVDTQLKFTNHLRTIINNII